MSAQIFEVLNGVFVSVELKEFLEILNNKLLQGLKIFSPMLSPVSVLPWVYPSKKQKFSVAMKPNLPTFLIFIFVVAYP